MLKEAQGEIEKLRDSSDVESVVSSTSTAAEVCMSSKTPWSTFIFVSSHSCSKNRL